MDSVVARVVVVTKVNPAAVAFGLVSKGRTVNVVTVEVERRLTPITTALVAE